MWTLVASLRYASLLSSLKKTLPGYSPDFSWNMREKSLPAPLFGMFNSFGFTGSRFIDLFFLPALFTHRPQDIENTIEIRGRDLISGLPKNIVVNSAEMKEALQECVNDIAECAHSVLEKTPPELAADIADKGIVMTGGGALLDGLDKLIQEYTKVPVYVAEDSVSCVAFGTGKVLDYIPEK